VKHLTRRTIAATLACAAALLHYPVQAQQDFPNRTIRVVVPFAPGGGGDVLGRFYGQKLSEALNVPVIVENRPGASTMIASDFVAKAAPDGYTILLNVPLLIQTPHLYSKMPYDPLVDLKPVTDLGSSQLWFAVSTQKTKALTIKEFVADAKLHPKDYNYASIGAGSSGHLLGYQLNEANGLSMLHVAYKGSTPATLALMAGEISAVFLDIVTLKPQLASGKVRLLASTGAKRSPLTPDVPTLAESGYAGFDTASWAALFVPSKVPADVLARLETETRKILAQPEVITKWRELGFEPGGQPPAQFAAQMRADSVRWGGLIKKAGVKLD